MYPILFQHNAFVIPSWHVFFMLAALAALVSMHAIAQRTAPFFRHPDLIGLYCAGYCGGYLGARWLSVAIEQPEVAGFSAMVRALLNVGPLTFFGGVLGGGAVIILFAWARRLSLLHLADVMMPSLLLGLAIGRIGCFLNGDDYGCTISLSPDQAPPWWVVKFPYHEEQVYRYPVQLWESFGACLILVGVGYLRGQQRAGRRGLVSLFAYCLLRFCIEFWRDDPRGWIGPLSTSQGISAGILVLGGVGLVARELRSHLFSWRGYL